MITLLLATRNRHKVRELRRLLKGIPIRWVTLDCFAGLPKVREDRTTFQGNAAKKAVEVSRHTILPVIAEDSGLEVRTLGSQPGVKSARFAGPAQDDRANVQKLLRLLSQVPPSRRQARFICCMALALGGRLIQLFEGSCSGSIALRPAGRTGFGYDPVFIPRGYQKTFAQLGARTKDRHSHRTQAARALKVWLRGRSPRGA